MNDPVQIRKAAEKIAFPELGADLEELTADYFRQVEAYREDSFRLIGEEYQEAIDSLQGSFTYLSNLDGVIDTLRTTRESNEKLIREGIESSLSDLQETFGLPDERLDEIRSFVHSIPGLGRIRVMEMVSAAYAWDREN